MRTAVLTVSSPLSRREGDDEAGPLLAELAEGAGAEIIAMEVVPDDFALIEDRLRNYVDEEAAVILTVGGTGLGVEEVTPEATLAVVDRLTPGLSEAMRAEAMRRSSTGVLDRCVAGIAGRTLIVNFPGGPTSVRELFGVIASALPIAVATLQGVRGTRGSH
jgi:molybdenum cofactor synthesis domain-containing protein